MKLPDPAIMAKATRLTREGKLQEAMALLSGKPVADHNAATEDGIIDMTPPKDGTSTWTAPEPSDAAPRGTFAKGGLREHLSAQFSKIGDIAQRKSSPNIIVPPGAQFQTHSFANRVGQRAYKLYVPSRPATNPALIVMLHGCTQSPDDFAVGTRMNALAETHGFLVAYPAQTQAANAQKCWNWFNVHDQQRDQGEPSILADLTREIITRHGVDPKRVFVAGLSAGGAAAAIMGATYPDLFSGIGVHSGLACGAARDMASAFKAMSGGAAAVKANGSLVRTIVFHGDHDHTVQEINGQQVLSQARNKSKLKKTTVEGVSTGGVRFTRTTERVDQEPVLEHWALHGVGHAWSGGSPDGTYTDPRGPDASLEMVRFFLGL